MMDRRGSSSAWLIGATTLALLLLGSANFANDAEAKRMGTDGSESGRLSSMIMPQAPDAASRARLHAAATSNAAESLFPDSQDRNNRRSPPIGEPADAITPVVSFFSMAIVSGLVPLTVALLSFGVLLLWRLMRTEGDATDTTTHFRIEPSLNNDLKTPRIGSMDNYERGRNFMSD
jgi:hypothetical protein